MFSKNDLTWRRESSRTNFRFLLVVNLPHKQRILTVLNRLHSEILYRKSRFESTANIFAHCSTIRDNWKEKKGNKIITRIDILPRKTNLVVPLVLFSSRSMVSSMSTTLTSGSSLLGNVVGGTATGVVADKRWWLAIAVTAANCSLYRSIIGSITIFKEKQLCFYLSRTLLNMSIEIFVVCIDRNLLITNRTMPCIVSHRSTMMNL